MHGVLANLGCVGGLGWLFTLCRTPWAATRRGTRDLTCGGAADFPEVYILGARAVSAPHRTTAMPNCWLKSVNYRRSANPQSQVNPSLHGESKGNYCTPPG